MLTAGKSWKTRLAVSSFLLIFLTAAVAPAELKIFPVWERLQCGSPAQEYACYDFEQAKGILKLDLDLQLKFQEFDALKLKHADLNTAYEKLDKANTLLGQAIERLEQRNQEKQAVLEKTTVELKKAEQRSVWNYLPWIITGCVVFSAAAFGVGFYIGTR